MSEISYIFIDGGYLHRVFKDTINRIFGSAYEIDFSIVKRALGARRAYYYDCVDNIKKPTESNEDLQSRVAAQEAYLDRIDAYEGFHVRRGHLAPGRLKQQKEVDVLLAVDMMAHSYNRNMTKAVLISGDRDFKPVVQSVTRAGTYVAVMYHKRSGSRELGREADDLILLDIGTLVQWVKLGDGEDRRNHFPFGSGSTFPSADNLNHVPGSNSLLRRQGKIEAGDQPMVLRDYFSRTDGLTIFSVYRGKTSAMDWRFSHVQTLENFITELYGEIIWDSSPSGG